MSGRPWLIAVTVDGVNLPRFLRRAGEMGLLLTGVRIRGKHLSAVAREDDVMTLRRLALLGGQSAGHGTADDVDSPSAGAAFRADAGHWRAHRRVAGDVARGD